ncbi:putative membrane protein YccC [Oerskovia jenensis]|uniref:Membrane protein YccC n=1 Tax=Oerskovia jenensis TaxID=162169 RepID=A0ABS2LGR9_9CELL|nr:putative membrane protein YccC [Oerskovia jenensis]
MLALVAIVLFLGGRILMYFIRPELAFALLLVLLAIVSSNRRLFASSLILLGYGAVTTVLSYISAIDDSRLVMLALDLGSIALFWYLGAKELKRERSNDK